MPIELPYKFYSIDTSSYGDAVDSKGDVIGKAVPASALDENFNKLAQVVNVGPTAPINPYPGMIWLDTSSNPPVIKQYDGSVWRSSVAVANIATTANTANDSDKVDGFHASQTPTANTVPVAGVDGKLVLGWLPPLVQNVRLGARESVAIWKGPGFNDASGYVITGIENWNQDAYPDSVYRRPLQILINNTWYTVQSI